MTGPPPPGETMQAQDRLPTLWEWFRRITIFLLGVLVILDSLAEKTYASIGKLIVGLLMIGVMPLDDLLRAAGRGRPGRAPDGGAPPPPPPAPAPPPAQRVSFETPVTRAPHPQPVDGVGEDAR